DRRRRAGTVTIAKEHPCEQGEHDDTDDHGRPRDDGVHVEDLPAEVRVRGQTRLWTVPGTPAGHDSPERGERATRARHSSVHEADVTAAVLPLQPVDGRRFAG